MKGTGWVAEQHSDEDRARHIAAVAGLIGAAPLPAQGGVQRPIVVADQSDSEACTAFFGMQAVYGLTGFHGSPWVAWWAARIADGTFPANSGVSVSALTRALEHHGFPAAESWGPGSDGFSYEADPPAVARIGGQRHVIDVVPVWGDGDAIVAAVCQALGKGLPCGLVVEVDDGFREARNGRVGPAMPGEWPLHFTTLWGFSTAADGTRDYTNVNSWGLTWGNGGVAKLHEDRIRSSVFVCIARLP